MKKKCVRTTNLANTDYLILLIRHTLLPRFPIVIIKQAQIDNLPCPVPQTTDHSGVMQSEWVLSK